MKQHSISLPGSNSESGSGSSADGVGTSSTQSKPSSSSPLAPPGQSHSHLSSLDQAYSGQTHRAQLPHDLRGGVHVDLFAPQTITFVFFGPYKPFVSLVGDFNAWDTRRHPMLTDGQGRWWITLEDPGETRYGFYVAIDDQSHAWVADPYAREVRWLDEQERSDQTGEQEVWAFWPGSAGSRQRAADAYPWQSTEWQAPPLRDLIIYELCVRDFGGEWRGNHPHYGRFADLLPRLDYLAGLGVNAIELMPIQAFPGESSWGYNPVFYFAPAEIYGRPDELKRLIDACHARGMAVLLDVAFNHAWGQQPYYNIYPPLYGPEGQELQDWNPFFHHTPPTVNMWGGVDWDHFVPETTRYFQDVVRFWLEEYRIDGFRFDWVCGVDYDGWNPMRPDFNPYHGIGAICWAARQAKPDCLLIGEYWQLEGTHPAKTSARLVHSTEMDACWSGEFHHELEEILNQGWQWERIDVHRALGGFRERGFSTATQTVNFSCSHDEVRPEHEVKFYAWRHIQAPEGMSRQEVAMRKGLLGLIATLTAPGVPMIYAGQEFAEDTPRTIDFLPLTWSKLELAAHRAHFAGVQRLILARRKFSALRSDHIEFLANDFAREKVVRYRRWGDAGQGARQVVHVALNFDGKPTQISLPVSAEAGNGTQSGQAEWYDQITDRTVETRAGKVVLRLGPWEGAVLTPVL